MITESYYWKKPLLQGAKEIAKLMAKKNLTDGQFARVEREIFIGFYSVRKLIEASAKVTPSTAKLELDLTWYPKRNAAPAVDWYNRVEFWDLYDLEDVREERRDLIFVSHRMIHSFIFMLDEDGVFFTSDRDKDKRLFFISTLEIVRAFDTVGNDYPSSVQVRRDPETGIRYAEAGNEKINFVK